MKPSVFGTAAAHAPTFSRIGNEAVPHQPSLEPDGSFEDGAHLEGLPVEGGIKPCTYIYELRAGVWHWLGWNDELPEDLTTKCGATFVPASHDVLELYAMAPIPRVEQTLCAGCKLPQDEAPPTLYLGSYHIAADEEPEDTRKAANKWTLRNRWQRWRQRRQITAAT